MKNSDFEEQLSKAIHLIQNGSPQVAEKVLLELNQINPVNSDLFNLIGVTYSLRNLHEEAIGWFGRGISICKTNDAIFQNLGTSLLGVGKIDEARAAFKKAIDINPNSVNSYFNLGNLYLDLGQYEDCIKSYNQALKIKDNFVDCLINKAVAIAKQGNADQALSEYKKGLNLEPENLKIHLNIASLYEKNRKFDEALAHYDKAILLKPDYPEAWNNKGVIFGELRRYDEALAHYDKAILLKPDYPEAWNNKGVIFGELRRYDEAINHYKQAISLDNSLAWSLGNLVHSKMMIADWREVNNDINTIKIRILEHQNASTPFPVLSMSDDEYFHYLNAKNFVVKKFPHKKDLGEIRKILKEKVKIAYFTSDFNNHPVIYLLNELFELHDRKKFTVYGFNIGNKLNLNDGDRVKKSFDFFIEASHLTDFQIGEKSRQLNIDIAIDLGGYTQNSRTKIFSYRAAPIQINFLGYPGTMGADYMDYIIADKQTIPKQNFKFYSEKVIWMPNSFITYDSRRKPSTRIIKRSEYGLPEEKFIYCCFNNAYKFNRKMVEIWISILRKNQESILWLSANNKKFVENISNEFIKSGISKDRLVFAGRIDDHEKYLAAYSLADLFLDTNPYNAHATALDALRGGLPVLTLSGNSFASRVGESILTALNLKNLITYDEEDYIKKAVEFGTDGISIFKFKDILNGECKKDTPFDSKTYVKNLEKFYEEAYSLCMKGLPPKNLI
jgi:protein O-GlcNAc transferase